MRMHGRDKGLVMLWGKPMVEHVLGRVAGQVNNIVISANRGAQTYARYGYPVLADELGQNWGPLAGIYTALRFVGAGYVLVVPCDTPCLPLNLYKRFQHVLEEGTKEIAVAHDGDRLHFTIAMVACSLADDLKHYLERGGRKVETWLRQHDFEQVVFAAGAGSFVNVNSEADLEVLEKQGGC